jgi:hypothetical protein
MNVEGKATRAILAEAMTFLENYHNVNFLGSVDWLGMTK